jgi:integrase
MSISFCEFRKGKKWVTTWRNLNGKKRTFSFATESEAANFLETQNAIAEKEKKILSKSRKKRTKPSNITVNELFDRYFGLAHTNPVTIRQSGYHASHVISAFGNRQCMRIEIQDILNLSEAQRMRGIAQSTINRRISVFRSALNWAVKNHMLPHNPLNNLRMPRAFSVRLAPPSPMESKAILKVARPHVQRVVILGLYSGSRIGPSELFKLQWRDVDIKNAMIRIPNAQKNLKFGDGRDVPIRQALLPIISAWKEHDLDKGIEHVISYGGNAVRCIGRAWKTALCKAGITRRIRPYDLRHAFATYALAGGKDGGADIGSVADIMGHSDRSMILKVYQHVQYTQKRAAVEAVPDILNLGNKQKKPLDITIGLPG